MTQITCWDSPVIQIPYCQNFTDKQLNNFLYPIPPDKNSQHLQFTSDDEAEQQFVVTLWIKDDISGIKTKMHTKIPEKATGTETN